MTPAEREARTRWMVTEAERLVTERRKLQRPVRAVTMTNQFYDPSHLKVDPQEHLKDQMAGQVIEALARRDRENR
ncbi:MAG: hypothetical protein JSS14_02315 [Proteobacteria bacterium]|nr:hypothetical protein [Pseudomonadota bacterium]